MSKVQTFILTNKVKKIFKVLVIKNGVLFENVNGRTIKSDLDLSILDDFHYRLEEL